MPGEVLSNVIGAPFSQYIIDQLNMRAAMNSSQNRTDEQVLFLANKMSFTRLTSSVRIHPKDRDGQKFYANLFDGEVPPGVYTTPESLAKNWILQGGTTEYNNGQYDLRYGIGPNGAYGLGGTQQQGYRPMPGIMSANIESKGTLGSLREANINFQVWNIVQLNVMEALYFRLGYTMLLEWGHINYFNNKGEYITQPESVDIFNPKYNSKESVLQAITQKNRETSGNYDAMLGVVTNFYFSFNAQGGFDCNIKLLGLGSVIDTVRINQTFVMPNSLFVEVQQQQALVQQKIEQQQEEVRRTGDEQARIDQGLAATLIGQVRNADGIKEVYKASLGTQAPANFLTTIQYASSQYTAFEGVGAYDYYYKATGGSLPRYNEELNDKRTGLFLNVNAKGRPWQLIPANVGSTNPQPVTLNASNLVGLASRAGNRFVEENIGGITVDFTTIDLQRSYSTVNRDSDTDLNGVAGNASFYLSLVNTGITDWVQRQNEKVTKSFRAPYPYVITSPDGVPTQKFFSIYYQAKSDSSTQDTTKQVLQALQSWSANPKVSIDYVGIISVGSQKSIGYHGTFEAAALDGKKIKFEFTSNDTGLIQTVEPRASAQTVVPPPTLQANPTGETEGAQNQATASQTTESARFRSALHAMLVAVKAQGQSEGINSTKAVVPIDLTKNTKIFYQFGVLKNVFDTAPAVSNIGQFDITTYAQKGFNSNLMADNRLLPTIKNVDFKSLCTAYLLKYQFSEGNVMQTNAGEFPVYIKFGYLLAFLNNMCLLYEAVDKANASKANNLNTIKPYFYIDFHPDYNFCLTAPQHMSVDPTICLIPLQASDAEYLELFPEDVRKSLGATAFKPSSENPFSAFIAPFKTNNAYQGKTMEILLNAQYLMDTADRFIESDKEGAVALKPFLDQVLSDITKVTGGFNVFRTAYRDDSNTVIIKDDQYTPNLPEEAATVLDKSSYKANRQYMELKVFGSGSLVRDMEFKTNMSTKMSSMIAISAQAGNQVANSQDATPLGTYNTNYEDAFMTVKINSLTTGSASTTLTTKQETEQAEKQINTLEEAAKTFNEHVRQVYKNGYVSKPQIASATSYYLDRFRNIKATDPTTTAAPFIPANLSLTMDGISGIVMGNAFTVPESRLPASLRGADGFTKVGFAVVGLSHTLEANQWLTKIRGQMIKLRDAASAVTARVAGENVSQIPLATAEGTVTTASGCQTSYPELPILPSVQTTNLSVRDAATYLRANHPDVAKAVFAIIFAEAAKSGPDNFRSAGGNNFGGVQTDSGRWGFGNFTGQFCRRDSGGTLRMFAAFATPQAFLDFLANRVKAKGFSSNETADQWVAKYISSWWSPVAKETYTRGTTVYNSKLAIYNTAQRYYNQA